jgi:UDP-glucose 4-epimerase
MRILIAGGAGYIGSVVTEYLIKKGHEVVVLDNISTGHQKAVHPDAVFVQADLRHLESARQALETHPVDAVMHFCALSLVGESVNNPLDYYENNVMGGVNLLRAMIRNNVKRLIFSSTAAVYGQPEETPIREDFPTQPTNPYGQSKLAFENLLHWTSEAHGLQYTALRYFNAAGASEKFGEDHRPETHLIPIVLQTALGKRQEVSVFGEDYPTRDGSCIRDYVHVLDLAQAHLLALEALEKDPAKTRAVYNLGNGEGYSVLEVLETAREITHHPIPARRAERRAGDPAILVASSDKIRKELGWAPEYPQLDKIIQSAWLWHQENPDGYEKEEV